MEIYERALLSYRPRRSGGRTNATSLIGDVVVDIVRRRTAPCTIADLGAGAGELAREITDRSGCEVLAVDASPNMVALARERGIDCFMGDATDWLENHSGRLHVAVASDFLEHLDREAQLTFLEALHRRLVDDGVAVIKTVNARGLFSRQIMYGDITHRAFLTPESADQLAEIAGFRVEQVIATDPRPIDRFGTPRRWIWRAVSLVAYLLRLVETGKRQRIWTENMILVLTKQPPAEPATTAEVA